MEETLRLGDCTIHALGTIPGFVPDAARVQAALEAGAITCVALGVPPEDVESLAALAAGATMAEPGIILEGAAAPAAGAPGLEGIHDVKGSIPTGKRAAKDADFDALDPTQQRFLELLGRFGQTRIPSPELEVAFAWATSNDRPVAALDMDDEAHAEAYIRANKFRHVLKSGRILKRIMNEKFDQSEDATSFALAWDAYLNDLPSLQEVESRREHHMAERLAELAKVHASVVAVLPAARFSGVLSHLQTAPS